MLYLLGGFAVLSGFLLLVYLFVNADPARLARGLKVTGIIIAVVAVATLAISGRLAVLLAPLAMMMPLLIRVRSLLDRYRPPAGGQTSTVATAFLRMTLENDGDHEVPLAQEMMFLNCYLAIEQVRFHDRLTLDVDVPRWPPAHAVAPARMP